MEPELVIACQCLNTVFWKVPSVTGTKDPDEDGTWWASELQDKDIRIAWSAHRAKFMPIDDLVINK